MAFYPVSQQSNLLPPRHSSVSIVHPNGLIRQIPGRKIATWKWFQEKNILLYKGWLQIPL